MSAFNVAVVVHEAIGHAGIRLVLGGRVLSVNSLIPQCTLQRPFIALVDPLANITFVPGIPALTAIRLKRGKDIKVRKKVVVR